MKATWEWRPLHSVSDSDMRTFGDTMYDLGRLRLLTSTSSISVRDTRNEARTASVALRKLLFQERLLHRVVQGPRFHKLVKPSDPDPFILGMDMRFSYLEPAEHLWTTHVKDRLEIHSLPGWTHSEVCTWKTSSEIFDRTKVPELNLGRWLNQPLLKIVDGEDQKVFSLGELVTYIANTEGAHTVDYKRGKSRDSRFLEMLGDQDTLIYPHWVVLCVAAYLYNRQQLGLAHQSEAWGPYVEKNMVTGLDYPIQKDRDGRVGVTNMTLEGEIRNLGFRRPFNPIGVSLDNIELPPPEYQESRWIITSAVR